LSTSPISKLRAADDERRQAKRGSLADKLAVEAKALADLKIEKVAVEGERRTVEADLGPVKYLAALLGQADEGGAAVVHPRRGTAAGPGGGLAPAGKGGPAMIIGRGRCTPVTGRPGRRPSSPVWAKTGPKQVQQILAPRLPCAPSSM
jgi:hypothetical protein